MSGDAPAPRGLRIGLSGAPGVGKTTLARALGEALGIPVVGEEMRAHLERTGQPLTGLPVSEAERILHELWRERAAREHATPSFVADNCSLDFAAYGVFYDCLAEPAAGEPEPVLLREPRTHLALYDAVIVLPCGVLPYVSDGVRPASRSAQLRHHLIIDGMLRRYTDPRKVHHLPPACVALADRVAWVRARLAPPVPARRGTVYLVGAGPGDPGLVTTRGHALLGAADVVAHDALVSPAILALARPGAELVPVGRRHGSGATSYKLHPAVIQHALAGRSVVRLKAGDPLIFGRGGEEAEELRQAGIPFEIVPGISAALGAAAYAGIPLTHRDCASDVTFASGHDVDGGHVSHTAWSAAAAGTGTLVLFMAARTLAGNLARLIASGRAPSTPAAYIAAATTPQQQVVTGTLETLAALTAGADLAAPALIIVGDVVRLRDRIAWFGGGEQAAQSGARARIAVVASAGRSDADDSVETVDIEAVVSARSNSAHDSAETAVAVGVESARSNGSYDSAETVVAVIAPTRSSGTHDSAETAASIAPARTDSTISDPAKPAPRGLVVVYTGQGKGKTTAALGIVFRALGRGMRVAVVQFIKGKWKTGERLFAETLPGLAFHVMGVGFTWNSDDLSRDKAAAQAAWDKARQLIASGEYPIVVVDEITFAINYGFIELADVLAALAARPPHVHVIATGRKAPAELCAIADLVTDMTAVKHPFERGIKAQLGVDY